MCWRHQSSEPPKYPESLHERRTCGVNHLSTYITHSFYNLHQVARDERRNWIPSGDKHCVDLQSQVDEGERCSVG